LVPNDNEDRRANSGCEEGRKQLAHKSRCIGP
jgi:hypothetical protein